MTPPLAGQSLGAPLTQASVRSTGPPRTVLPMPLAAIDEKALYLWQALTLAQGDSSAVWSQIPALVDAIGSSTGSTDTRVAPG